MLSDRQDNGRVGDWHKHEDKRVGCYTGLWWIMTTPQNTFFWFFSFETIWFISFVVRFSDFKDKEWSQ